jgi:aspartate--ammonia ligase
MSSVFIPQGYVSKLDVWQTERAIKFIKDTFQQHLSAQLKLRRVTAPLVVECGKGLNDNLSGVEAPVSFVVDGLAPGAKVEIVQSLAKWKRYTLWRHHIEAGKGIYTDMNALRPCEELDNIHSLYVDQWDWEKVITKEQRTLAFLKKTVRRIYEAIKVTENKLYVEFPQIEPMLPEEIFFIHSEQLLLQYPNLTPKERENAITKKHKAVFIIGIGGELSDGTIHDGRAADYDDWTTRNEDGYEGLNGDLLLWNPVLNSAFEVSSMGIRVDETALQKQLKRCRSQFLKLLKL